MNRDREGILEPREEFTEEEKLAYAKGVRDERGRLAELLRAGRVAEGGGNIGRVEMAGSDVRMMPDAFVDAYGQLWEAGLRAPGSSVRPLSDDVRIAPRVRLVRTSSGQIETRGLARGSRKTGASPQMIGSERALALKARIDRKLRKISRDILASLASGRDEKLVRRCTMCKKFGEDNWAWCPYDGKAMENVD